MINRRSLITGLISLVAAPAIVRAGSLMPVKVMEPVTFDPYPPLTTINGYPIYRLDGGVLRVGEIVRGSLFNVIFDGKRWIAS